MNKLSSYRRKRMWFAGTFAIAGMALVFSNPASAAAQAGGKSFSLKSGKDTRVTVTVERGEALVAYLIPGGDSQGTTRVEAYFDGERIGRVSGSKDEVLRWNLPWSVADERLQVELRFTCRSKTCDGAAQWVVSTSKESPAPLVSAYINQRSFTTRSGVCKNDDNATIYDGACMCSDASTAMALVLAGSEDITDSRDIAEGIWEETKVARRPHNGGQVVGELIAAIEDLHGDYDCAETKVSSGSFEQRLKDAVRLGDPVLFRSRGFSNAGHYVNVLGFKQVGSSLDLTVNDPMGRWIEKNRWQLNSNSAGSNVGQRVTYPLSKLKTDASIIVCTP